MHRGGIRLMMLAKGADKEIKCGLASRNFKKIFRIPSKEDIIPEIGMLKPDVVIIDFNLYDQIGGSETLNFIRDQFELNAWFE